MMRLLVLLAFSLAASVPTLAAHVATRLRVEYLESPLGIDVAVPRFSWALLHSSRAEYMVRVIAALV
jgi:hypothetical protein